ncbi:Hint domain-containing protein [Thioclava sp. FR2]|uniref:Hint domain-containing protein n=1 Tax=Thioclava sp. FR2 TaxID=3445780 RepID=UPI003EB725B5
MAIYTDQFFVIDPGAPPPAGTALSVVKLQLNDIDNNNFIQSPSGDTVGGLDVTGIWVNDRITVVMNGVTTTITGVTFYRDGGPAVFTPTDGTILENATFVSSRFVKRSTQIDIGALGPPCFLQGTLIDTDRGPRRIEDLKVGDLIQTLDNGLQPLRWIGRRTVSGMGEWAPIRFMPAVLGNERALLVSPQHRMLVRGWMAELYFGQSEVLVAAKHLVNGDTICRTPKAAVAYLHLMFDRHEIIFADGAPAESLLPGDEMLKGNPHMQAEIVQLFPELESDEGRNQWAAARRCIRGRDAKVLRVA